ncbi:hypothetical protein NDU88_005814 [Pleurodeles waltl]|uniref:Uncharacterized protein n=1 Tax=Pleurodeles waltl TaxID=8319 RepID=A0AAV7L3M9_PLEWA|nr:hypothetical protein NDU88_005814 [Pleurodeles waltl]
MHSAVVRLGAVSRVRDGAGGCECVLLSTRIRSRVTDKRCLSAPAPACVQDLWAQERRVNRAHLKDECVRNALRGRSPLD